MNTPCIEEMIYVLILIALCLAIVAFCAGLFFGRREGFLKGKAEGKKESSRSIMNFLTRKLN